MAQHPSAQWGLILEDDVSLVVPEVHRELRTILDQLPESWTAAAGLLEGFFSGKSKENPEEILEMRFVAIVFTILRWICRELCLKLLKPILGNSGNTHRAVFFLGGIIGDFPSIIGNHQHI